MHTFCDCEDIIKMVLNILAIVMVRNFIKVQFAKCKGLKNARILIAEVHNSQSLCQVTMAQSTNLVIRKEISGTGVYYMLDSKTSY